MSQNLAFNVTTLVQHVLQKENSNVHLVLENYLFTTDNVLFHAQMVGILKIMSVLFVQFLVKLVPEVIMISVLLVMKPNTYKMENVKILVIHITMKTKKIIPVTHVVKTVQNVQLVVATIVLNAMTDNI